jgi:hypothetical protein
VQRDKLGSPGFEASGRTIMRQVEVRIHVSGCRVCNDFHFGRVEDTNSKQFSSDSAGFRPMASHEHVCTLQLAMPSRRPAILGAKSGLADAL